MSRTVAPWSGKTDDTKAPPRVQARIAERYGRKCAHCGNAIGGGVKMAMDHITALINGGSNSEDNLQPLCIPCHADKTKVDVALKSKTADIAKKHLGIIRPKGNWGAGRNSKWKRKMDGTTERRNP